MNFLHTTLTENLAGGIQRTIASAKYLAKVGGVDLSKALEDFSASLQYACMSRHEVLKKSSSPLKRRGGGEAEKDLPQRETAPGSLRLAEEAQTVLSGALASVANEFSNEFQMLETKYGDRAKSFISIEVQRLCDLRNELDRLRDIRDAKSRASLESVKAVSKKKKSFAPRRDKIAKQREDEANQARREYESARFRYLRRANHTAIAASNDVTQRTMELYLTLQNCFERAARLLRRVGPELERVRALTMKAAVQAVSDDAIWIERCKKLREASDLPPWCDDTIYLSLPPRHCELMKLAQGSTPHHMGWLMKVASNQTLAFSRASRWRRRWFWINMGTGYICYVKHRSREIIDVCDLTITTARRCVSKLHSFELVSPTFQHGEPYLLQAETSDSLEGWLKAIQSATTALLARRRESTTSASMNSSRRSKKKSTLKESVATQLMILNPRCADCGAPSADWASINLGIVICLDCSGCHRAQGVGVSQVRSLILDDDCWDEDTMSLMNAVGNVRSNEIWASTMESHEMLHQNAPRGIREAHIRCKYVQRKWVDRSLTRKGMSPNEALRDCAKRGDTIGALRLVASGADVSSHDPDTGNTPLHHAAMTQCLPCIVLLLRNGALPNAVNVTGRSPFASLVGDCQSPSIPYLLRPKTPDIPLRYGRRSDNEASVLGTVAEEEGE
eukprot:g1361.t1